VVFAGLKISLERPRVRTREGQEVELESYGQLQQDGKLQRAVRPMTFEDRVPATTLGRAGTNSVSAGPRLGADHPGCQQRLREAVNDTIGIEPVFT